MKWNLLAYGSDLLCIGLLSVAFFTGCGHKPETKCGCGQCNKTASGMCLKCTDVNCTPLGTSPCCDNCTCGK